MEFSGKVVLITGSTTGIGRAAAEAFLREGATVGVNHLGQSEPFTEMVEKLRDLPGELIECPGDVRSASAVQEMVGHLVARAGRLDILVNNAGISQVKPFLETTEEDWNGIIDTDLKSVFLCCRAAIPHLLVQGGAIVNIASELALSGRARFGPYTAAKGGVISLTRSLAREFAPSIRVNAVAPGPTWTPLLEKEAQAPGHKEDMDEIPLGRYAEPSEIAESILFLASPRASYFCGDVISPNGGAVMR